MSDSGTNEFPSGLTLRRELRGHLHPIHQIAWSPDGQMIASGSRDSTVRLWDVETGKSRLPFRHDDLVVSIAWSPDGKMLASGSRGTIWFWDVKTGKTHQKIEELAGIVYSLAWSPDGQTLASSSTDRTVQLWDTTSGKLRQSLVGHSEAVNSVAWSPDGQILASGSKDHTVRLWNAETGQLRQTLKGGSQQEIASVVWSPDRRILASCTKGCTIQLWNLETGRVANALEAHYNNVQCATFSADGKLLASKSYDGMHILWRSDRWEVVSTYQEEASTFPTTSLAFHPKLPILASLKENDTVICISDVDTDFLLGVAADTVHYTNAKVVLVGDTGVGKSGLGLALTNQPFIATESTHGRRVWNFDSKEVKLDGERTLMQEILLWDLAGQPGYRLIHQLHLNEVTVALVVFDARSETDPFAGVRHWDRALRHAQYIQGDSALPMIKFLVAARVDVGGIPASQARIGALVHDLGFDDYFATSAKEGWQIAELDKAIREAIDWKVLPTISSTKLFQSVKTFLVKEKEAGRLLSTKDDLYHTYKSWGASSESKELHAQFETCIVLVESRGLIRRLSFGNLVLLQPELLDSYASAMVNEAKDEPDGLGSITEEDALVGRFRMAEDERIKDKGQEKLLLIATVEELLRHEIVLREQADQGPYLVFPSQFTRERPDLPDPQGKSVIFEFEGPILNIYVTLVVRLSHSGAFAKKEMWKNAVTYTARVGGICGMFLREIEEGRGELTLFFDSTTSEETQFQFEEYINAHFQRRALPNSIHRRRIFICAECGTPVTDLQATRRRERGFKWIRCNVCGNRIWLFDREERLAIVPSSAISEMENLADMAREREAAATILQGKIVTGDFDVFLCYNDEDKLAVKEIGEQLKERGVLPWLDEWEQQPGVLWQQLLEGQISQIRSAAVFVGAEGISPWQREEVRTIRREFERERRTIIPVILPNYESISEVPFFPGMEDTSWVDFRKSDHDPLEQLIHQITGEHHDAR